MGGSEISDGRLGTKLRIFLLTISVSAELLVKGPRQLGFFNDLKLDGVNVLLECHSWDLHAVELTFRNTVTTGQR